MGDVRIARPGVNAGRRDGGASACGVPDPGRTSPVMHRPSAPFPRIGIGRGLGLRRRAGVALLAAALATPAGAQQFMGTAVAPDGQTPTGGVLVTASDSTGRLVAQGVTNAEGRFTLFVDSAMTLTFRLERTGFQPTVVATRRLGTDEVVDLVAVLGDTPIAVPPLARGLSTCGRLDATERAAMGVLLDEARKAFLAAQATIGRPDLSARYATFDHRVAKTTDDTLRSLYRRGEGPLPSLFRATTAEELEEGGFFVTVAGERIFRAPEPALLAGAWWTTTHCFTVATGAEGGLRLTFRPTRERKGLVDLEGAYVLDPRTLAPRRVEFRYIGLREQERFAEPQGMLELLHLRSGDWVTVGWWQRFPLLGYRTGEGATTLVRTSMTLVDVIGHRVQGGRVLALESDGRGLLRVDPVDGAGDFGRACGERVVSQQTGALRGQIAPQDSESVAGVLVRATWKEPVVVDRREFTTREQIREAFTDPAGRFTICDVPMRRDATLRWEVRGQERAVPITIGTPGAVQAVPIPRRP